MENNTLKYHEQSIKVEEDIYKIMTKINPIYRTAVVNMALRTFMDTPTFKYYFSNEENTSDINNIDPGLMSPSPTIGNVGQVVQTVSNTQNSPNTQPQVNKPATTWDDF